MMTMMVVLYIIFQGYFSRALGASTLVYPVHKNHHTRAFFTNFDIGNPHKSFELHIDSGNDLTWVQCDITNTKYGQHHQGHYKPTEDKFVKCADQLCAAIQGDNYDCPNPNARCKYLLDHYADGKSTEGYLVKDIFSLHHSDGSVFQYKLVFGCGYKQMGDFEGNGVLGLSRGKVSLLSQMDSNELTTKVTGHCLSSGGDGFLFFGDGLIPSGVSWTPIAVSYKGNYLTESVDLLFDEKETQVKQLEFDFDSGFSLSYLDQEAYEQTLDLINKALKGTPLTSTDSVGGFSICWGRHQEPITTLDDITSFFKKLTLKFTKGPGISKLEIPIKDYLAVAEGKVCLGISDGAESDLENPNAIGVNFMQDKLVIYDSVYTRIGWTTSTCQIP